MPLNANAMPQGSVVKDDKERDVLKELERLNSVSTETAMFAETLLQGLNQSVLRDGVPEKATGTPPPSLYCPRSPLGRSIDEVANKLILANQTLKSILERLEI